MTGVNQGRKHGPNRLDRYIEIHNTALTRILGEGFVLSEDLAWGALGDRFLTVTGHLYCIGALYLSVDKRLLLTERSGSAYVETVAYSYSAVLHKIGSVFRYDSPHEHRPYHHVHRFDVLRGGGKREPDPIDPPDTWPTLAEVAREFEGWYYDHLAELQARGLAG